MNEVRSLPTVPGFGKNGWRRGEERKEKDPALRTAVAPNPG